MKDFSYGGQAVIEGVMMRGKHYLAIAVRKANNQITVRQDPLKPWSNRYPWLKKPVLRGSFALIETMIMGLRCLTYSANEYADAEEEQLTTKELVMTMGFAFLLTIGLFVVLPAFIIRQVQSMIPSNIMLNIVEGAIKISFFVLYIIGISFLKDIQRVFQYHGAEHKAINCYETNQPLTVENVRKCSPIHARCGTNFLLIVMFMSILIFSLFGRPPFFQRIVYHLAIIPIVAGLSYEIIRQAGKANCNPIFKWVAIPGMGLQLLTTRQPDDAQIEVAIQALQTVVEQDASHVEEQKVKPFPLSSPSV